MLGDRTINAFIDTQKGKGPHPLLVIAPSRTEKMKDPSYEKIAALGVKAGFVVIRFNWGMSALSSDLKREAEDLATVLSSFTQGRVNKPLEINPDAVALLADGLSARISMMPESKVTKSVVQMLILLNPECDAGNPFPKLYAPLANLKSTQRLIIVPGNPGNGCETVQIYDAVKSYGETLSLYTFPGGKDEDTIHAAIFAALRGPNWEGPDWENDAQKKTKKEPHSNITHSH